MSVEQSGANLKNGTGSFTKERFLELYPYFAGKLPDATLAMFILSANHDVIPARWHEKWEMGAALYVAHFSTMYLKSCTGEGASGDVIASKSDARGSVTSKSVDGISIGYAASGGSTDLMGYSNFKDTIYGQQFATLARMVGKGGMYVP